MKRRLTIVLAALLILAVAAAAWLLQKVPVPGASPETAAELEALGLDPAAFAMYPEDALVYIARQLRDCEFLHLRAAGGSALGEAWPGMMEEYSGLRGIGDLPQGELEGLPEEELALTLDLFAILNPEDPEQVDFVRCLSAFQWTGGPRQGEGRDVLLICAPEDFRTVNGTLLAAETTPLRRVEQLFRRRMWSEDALSLRSRSVVGNDYPYQSDASGVLALSFRPKEAGSCRVRDPEELDFSLLYFHWKSGEFVGGVSLTCP